MVRFHPRGPTSGGCYDIAKRNQGLPRTSVNGVSKKFKRMSEIYKMFARDWEQFHDFNDEALLELYNSESYGGPVSQKNGFALGKKWLSVNVAMWKEDIDKGLLHVRELYEDPKFPHWWLDSVFKK